MERIEDERPRELFPSVYASLLAIHDGQMRSLAQQGGIGLADADLLDITFRKGGSSVLTDLYLVTDVPQPLEERFAFGYGIFLQLLDDLQDVEADLAAGQETLFTRAARRGPLDEVAARLACFIDTVLLRNGRFEGPVFRDRLDLIRRNCLALLVGSVAEQPHRFSRRFPLPSGTAMASFFPGVSEVAAPRPRALAQCAVGRHCRNDRPADGRRDRPLRPVPSWSAVHLMEERVGLFDVARTPGGGGSG